MRVAELWRYPVKSLQGERLTGVDVGPEGLAGDRQWALFDVTTGYGLTARRVPDLLFLSGRLRPDRGVEVVLPDGSVTSDAAVLSAWLGRTVALRAAADAPGERLYENPAGVGEEAEYDWDAFTGDTLRPGQRRRSVAVEPMTCPPNALADHVDLVVLDPGAEWSGTWTLTWVV